ncbi:hypothetical protein MACJ_000773 [Theileria orientalis]|uniref:Uncharacterized protein n=1 Tax=Theileria orientalis TaxID=68886 RepID=A0A976QQP3_THEOR|nr:hypothetical protein MACJ_000773 [Theileria orientalis]
MLNKCVKLILILALVVAVAFGISFLPFSLSDKFKQVAEKVTSHIKGLAGVNRNAGAKLNLDFSKRDTYKLGDFNVVFDKVNNVPKAGFHKFVHKGENDATLDVEKFFNGETELEGLEGGVFDYAAAYFKGESPHLLLVELALHDPENDAKPENAGENKEGEAKEGANKAIATPEGKKGLVMFFAPGENNRWVKLPEGANLAHKVEEVFRALSTAAAAAPNETPVGGNAGGAGASPAGGAGAGPAPTGGEGAPNVVPVPGPAPPVPAARPGVGGEAGGNPTGGAAAGAPGVGNGANPGPVGARGEAGSAGPGGVAGAAGVVPNPPTPDAARSGLPSGGVNPGTHNAGGHASTTHATAGEPGLRGVSTEGSGVNPQSGGNSNGNNHGGSGGAGHGTSNGGGSSGSSSAIGPNGPGVPGNERTSDGGNGQDHGSQGP